MLVLQKIIPIFGIMTLTFPIPWTWHHSQRGEKEHRTKVNFPNIRL